MEKSENSVINIFQKMLLSDGHSFQLSIEDIEKLTEFKEQLLAKPKVLEGKASLFLEQNINNPQIIINNRIFCDLCLHDYRIDNYKKHLKSKKHLKNIYD